MVNDYCWRITTKVCRTRLSSSKISITSSVPKSNTLMRSYFARTGRTPTVAQIRENLGSLIADALFASIPFELRECIGLEPKLKGPSESLWTSPSVQLTGDLKLSVLPCQRHAHVITHNAILEIGQDIEELLNKMRDEELQRKLEEQQRTFDQMLEDQVQSIRKKIIREFYVLSSFKMRELFNQMEADFNEEWKKRETFLLTEAEKERVEGIRLLEEAMKCELDNVTRLHEDKYTSQLNFLVEWEKAEAHDKYHLRIMELQGKWSKLFEDAKHAESAKFRAEMAEHKARYETEIWSTITRERENADQLLYDVVKFSKGQLLTLDEEINSLRDKFAEACAQKDANAEDIEAWKCVLRDLFNQFQKFINFVLKEIPGQANYLLSLSEIIKNRKDCLPRVRKDVGYHRYMDYQKQKEESWDEILVRPIDKTKDPTLFDWKSQIDIDDEDDDRRKMKDKKQEEEYLKELAKGKQNDECIKMIKNMSEWILKKADNVQITPSVSSLTVSSKKTEEVETFKVPLIDPEVLQYVEFMEKPVPKPLEIKKSQKEILESMVRKESEKLRSSLPVADSDLEFPDPCPEPFVAKRINSILNILDAHPYLRKAINES